LPGHEINLKIHCDGQPTITDIQWSLPGEVFKNYNTSEATGTLTPLDQSDLQQITVKFHWADVGEDRNVSVAFKTNGTPCQIEETFNVKDPIVEFPTVGGVSFDPPPIGTPKVTPTNWLQLRDAYDGETAGIVFKAKVQTPDGFNFGVGKWYFGQLAEPSFIQKVEATQNCYEWGKDEYINDAPWPYETGADPGNPPWDTGDTIATVKDSPGKPLGSIDQLTASLSFKMYIMFKPANDPPGAGESAYVPLRREDWGTEWCAEKNAAWDIKMKQSLSSSWVVERAHPEWTDHSGNLSWEPTECPGACP